jgi:hypothetical protein
MTHNLVLTDGCRHERTGPNNAAAGVGWYNTVIACRRCPCREEFTARTLFSLQVPQHPQLYAGVRVNEKRVGTSLAVQVIDVSGGGGI